MSTKNERAVSEQGAPARDLVLVTKSDSDQAVPLLALRIYVASGNGPVTLKITPLDALDAAPITLTLPDGLYWEPCGAKRVWSTGSSGTCIIHGTPASNGLNS